MSEKINLDNLSDIVSFALFAALAKSEDKDKIIESRNDKNEMNVDFKINGIDLKFSTVLEQLNEQLEGIIEHKAEEKAREGLSLKFDNVRELLDHLELELQHSPMINLAPEGD